MLQTSSGDFIIYHGINVKNVTHNPTNFPNLMDTEIICEICVWLRFLSIISARAGNLVGWIWRVGAGDQHQCVLVKRKEKEIIVLQIYLTKVPSTQTATE